LGADWERVFELAAERDKALEINSYPDRQDLQLDLLALAREAGVRLSIATDAHNEAELAFIDVGLAAALKAGIPRDRILNFGSAEAVQDWVAGLRS
jgi:DNA polymerase (family 10)